MKFELKITTEMGEVITYFAEAEKISELVSEWLLTSDETPLYGLEITPLD
jgi:hypothetical protein